MKRTCCSNYIMDGNDLQLFLFTQVVHIKKIFVIGTVHRIPEVAQLQTIGAPSNWRISPRFLTTTFHACIRSQQKNRKVACHEKKVLSITVKLFVSVLFLDKCPVIVSIPRYLSNVLQPSEIFIPTHACFNLSTISLGRRKPLLIIVLNIHIIRVQIENFFELKTDSIGFYSFAKSILEVCVNVFLRRFGKRWKKSTWKLRCKIS